MDQMPNTPKKMDWIQFRLAQESIRQVLMNETDPEKISAHAMLLTYFGFLRVPVTDYEHAIEGISENPEYYIHVIYRRDQWVFFDSLTEQSDETVYEIMRTAYPTKFPARH
jgi:hypothetical protein